MQVKNYLKYIRLTMVQIMSGDGLFRIVGKNGKIGFADTCGVIVIPPVFSYATPFHNGEAKVSFGGKNEKQGEYQS